ncbi:hypothetical protein SUGI_0368420 [Cryptomeria japonica]|nr:hypothetical protein SUGI_0368420 [Cryptomeria japonica]
MAILNNYNVEIVERELVLPAVAVQEHVLPLSNIDLITTAVGVHVLFCYEKPSESSFTSVVSNLKSSLSKSFVSFDAFSGRLVTNGFGEKELVCNNKGVEFAKAYALTSLDQVEFYNPFEAVGGKLVPLSLSKDSQGNSTPVFAVQVTEFSCGGIVVGCTFDHRVADAFSANMFFTHWSNISRNETIESITPSFTRSILVPRDPPNCCSEIDKMYMKLQPLPQPIKQIPEPAKASRIYYLSAKDIEKLQLSANEHGNNYSKLEAFSAYFWKLSIQGREINNTINCNIRIAIDGRSRLKKMGMPANYFGNVVSTAFAMANAGNVKEEPLSWAAKLIHDAIYRAANEEYFQSFVDLIEMSKPSIVVPRAFVKGDEPMLVVSSGLRFPLYDIDHGWGKPILASYYLPFAPGYVMPTRSPHADGSWLIYVNFLVDQLKAIESHPNFILHKISSDFFAGLKNV